MGPLYNNNGEGTANILQFLRKTLNIFTTLSRKFIFHLYFISIELQENGEPEDKTLSSLFFLKKDENIFDFYILQKPYNNMTVMS